MLVLSRRPDDKVVLPTVPVLIKVLSAQSGVVRLGFEAPASVPVLREELTRDGRPRAVDLRHGLTLLRARLAGAGPAVQDALDLIEVELEGRAAHCCRSGVECGD